MPHENPSTVSMPPASRPLRILLVEDNPGDVFLIKEALRRLRAAATTDTASDGQAALDWLRQRGGCDVVILDLNLPVKNGREVLREMRADPRLKAVPVAILTTSMFPEDAALPAGDPRCVFYSKTADMRQLVRVVAEISPFRAAGR